MRFKVFSPLFRHQETSKTAHNPLTMTCMHNEYGVVRKFSPNNIRPLSRVLLNIRDPKIEVWPSSRKQQTTVCSKRFHVTRLPIFETWVVALMNYGKMVQEQNACLLFKGEMSITK